MDGAATAVIARNIATSGIPPSCVFRLSRPRRLRIVGNTIEVNDVAALRACFRLDPLIDAPEPIVPLATGRGLTATSHYGRSRLSASRADREAAHRRLREIMGKVKLMVNEMKHASAVHAAVSIRPRWVTPISSSVSAIACIASDMSASVTSPMQPMRNVLASARRPGKMMKPRFFMPSNNA